MKIWYGMATGLLAVTIVAHVYGGGDEIHLPFLESNLSLFLKAFASVIWHMATVVMIINLGVLLIATFGKQDMTSAMGLIVFQSVGFVVVFMAYGIIRLGNITDMPQWIAFALLAGLIMAGLRAQTRIEA